MLPNATTTVTSSTARDFTSGSRGLATGNTVASRSALAPHFLTLRPALVPRIPADFGLAAEEAASGVEGAEPTPFNVSEINAGTTAARGAETSASGLASLVAEGEGASEDGAAGAAVRVVDEAVYEEVDLQDLEFDALDQQFVYPCPCGDLFELSLSDLRAAVAASTGGMGFAIASCPSCSLRVKVLFDTEQLGHMEKELSISLLPVGA